MPRRQPGAARRTLAFLTFSLIALTFAPLTPAVQAALQPSSNVAYLDRSNNLWLSQDNGENARQVTTSGGFTEIAWSPDGSLVAATGPYDDVIGVYLASPDPGYGLRTLAPGGGPAWAPDSTRLSIVSGGTIKVFDREARLLREAAVGADIAHWAPDSRRLGFTRIVENPYNTACPVRELGWFDTVSGETRAVSRTIGAFAWAGTRLLYVSASDGWVHGYDVGNGTSRRLSFHRANPCGGPFLTDNDGARLFFLDYAAGGDDLVVLDLSSGQERVFTDLPVGYPASTLPDSYLTLDAAARFAYVVRAFPTTVTRVDLQSGARTTLLADDYRIFLGFSPDHSRMALLQVSNGQPAITSVRDVATGAESPFINVGWLAWQGSAVTPGSVLAWSRVWDREDRPVAAGAVQRTWIWGPAAFATLQESYDQATGGQRAVRYYDKSRMEINTPNADQTSRWYVTNGLLAKELISGRLQLGDARFDDRQPAAIPVAGDPDDTGGPTYASLRGVLGAPPTQGGFEIRFTFDRAGNVGNTGPGGVFAQHFVAETNHTVADVFWAYLNSEGQVWNGTQFVTGKLFDPTFFATGFPITEAYWTRVKVGGQVKDVLVQCFERRCLTYTPDNPEGWQVEMGNVGRHYSTWRYGAGT